MKRLFIIFIPLAVCLSPFAQNSKSKSKTKVKAVTSQKTSRNNSQSSNKKKTYSTSSIRGLEGQRASIRKKIREHELALQRNKQDVQKRLQDLMVINSDIDKSQKNIVTIQKDITHIDGNISILRSQLETLKQQLQDRKQKYIKSMRYMARHRTVQDKLMFVFSAQSFTQMYRRLRFVREYAAFQKAQGEIVKAKQAQVLSKHRQLETVKGTKNHLLYKGQIEQTNLHSKQEEQQKVVQNLQQQQKTIQTIIAQQRQKDAALNAQIDRMVSQEVAKTRARATADASRKAAALVAAQKRNDDLAKKKAAAEAEKQENERRIASA